MNIQNLGFSGRYRIGHYRDGKLLNSIMVKNGIVTVGANNILDVMFGGGPVTTPWYIGLINGASATLAASDTMAAHTGWVENTAYTEGIRQEWVDDAAASRVKTNTADAVFTINATGTIFGLFLSSDSAKSGTAGILWSTAQLDTALTVSNLDILKVVYELTVS